MRDFNECKLFSLFIDKSNGRKEISEPFESEGWIAATESHICILVRPEYLKQSYEPNGIKVSKILSDPNIDIVITRTQLMNAINKVSSVIEKQVVRPAIECDECDGTGMVTWDYEDSELYTHHQDFDCPICNGTGNKYEAIIKPTGRMIPCQECAIGIYEQQFQALKILTICDAMQILGIDKLRYVGSYPQFGNIFILDEGIQIVLTTCIGTEARTWIKRKKTK